MTLQQVSENLQICQGCRARAGVVDPPMGVRNCPEDGATCLVHAQAGKCPKGLLIPDDGNIDAQALTLAKAAHGAVGLVKAALKINRASGEAIAARKAICAGCDRAVLRLGVFRQCSICKCALRAKLVNADEHCPLEPPKW